MVAFGQTHRVRAGTPEDVLADRLGLSTIPATGGSPTPVTVPPLTTWPPFPDWTRAGISFEATYNGQANVWRVVVDETTGATLGEAVPVLTSVACTQRATSSLDGRRTLFSTSPARFSISWIRFDPVAARLVGTRQELAFGSRDLRARDLSPDGEWIGALLISMEGRQMDARRDVFLVGLRTGETRRLTDAPLRKDVLSWAPDGSKLYFGVAPDGVNEVWSVRPDGLGRQPEVRAPQDGGVILTDVSPDGRTLWVASARTNGRTRSTSACRPTSVVSYRCRRCPKGARSCPGSCLPTAGGRSAPRVRQMARCFVPRRTSSISRREPTPSSSQRRRPSSWGGSPTPAGSSSRVRESSRSSTA